MQRNLAMKLVGLLLWVLDFVLLILTAVLKCFAIASTLLSSSSLVLSSSVVSSWFVMSFKLVIVFDSHRVHFDSFSDGGFPRV